MYSEKLPRFTEAILQVASLLGANPVLFNSQTRNFYTTNGSLLRFRFTSFVLITQTIFGVWRISHLPQENESDLFMFNLSYIITLAMVIPLICVFLVINTAEVVHCCNQQLYYISYLRKNWVSLSDEEIQGSYPTGRLLNSALQLLGIIVVGYYFSGCVVVYVINIIPFHWLSIVPRRYWSQYLYWTHLIFYSYLMLMSSMLVGIVAGTFICYTGKDTSVGDSGVDIWGY